VNNESAQLMMSVLDRQRGGVPAKDYKNDLDTSWRSQGDGSRSSPVEPTYADLMTSLSTTRRSDDELPAFPRHQLQVLGLLGEYVDTACKRFCGVFETSQSTFAWTDTSSPSPICLLDLLFESNCIHDFSEFLQLEHF